MKCPKCNGLSLTFSVTFHGHIDVKCDPTDPDKFTLTAVNPEDWQSGVDEQTVCYLSDPHCHPEWDESSWGGCLHCGFHGTVGLFLDDAKVIDDPVAQVLHPTHKEDTT